jgi:tetratricopeptide (TPR) repeat protein
MALGQLRRLLSAGLLIAFFAGADAPASAAPLAVPSQAPCSVSIGGIHIGLRHATGGKCAGTPAPQGPQGTQIRGGSTKSGYGTPGYVAGYSRTCSTQDGHDVCVARSGSHVSTCTKYNDAWRCTETSRMTNAQAACAAHASDPVPAGPVTSASSYSESTADVYYSARNWQALLAYADGWTRAQPRNANAWMILGNAYGVGIRNDAAAAAAFRKTIAVNPSWYLPYIGLGHAYLDQKCYDLAGAALEKAADRNPTASNWKNAAAAYSYAGRIDLADEMLISEQKHLVHPGAIDWYNLGCDFNKVEDPGHAEAALQRSVALNPRYANAWNNLGVADENLDKFDEAISEYKKAAALGDSLGTSNIAQLQALIAQQQRAARGRRGGAGYGSVCYDGATTVAANGATGACPPGFGVHQGDRSDDSGSSDGGGSMDSGGGGDDSGGGGGDSGGDT